jgi:two-component system nitrogen regulation response regulator NtrX
MSERILIVDDEPGIRSSLAAILEDEGYGVASAGTAGEAAQRLVGEAFDAVLLDLWLPDRDGLELLAELRERGCETPVIVISGHGTVDTAVQAIRLGACDFLEKPMALARVVVTVQNALERGRLEREVRELSERLEREDPLLGESAPMVRLKAEIRTAAAADSRILILGENGTGKELVARRIHRLSRRASKPFVEVNCAAIPEELIESELFGHVKGAFTGAAADRRGRFEQADGGTLFLDEIADMSLKTQAKVLRASRSSASRGWAAPRRFRWTCACWPPPTRTSRRKSGPAASARISTSAWPSFPSTCRLCAIARRTSPCWWSTSWFSSPASWGAGPSNWSVRPWSGFKAMPGRAMSASCATWWRD